MGVPDGNRGRAAIRPEPGGAQMDCAAAGRRI